MNLAFFAHILFWVGAVSAHDVLLEYLPAIPEGWRSIGDAAPGEMIRLRIAMALPNEKQFERALYQVSTPGHRKYGKHLSAREVKHMLQPREESVHKVLDWLSSSGVSGDRIEVSGDWVNFVTTAEKANKMLKTILQVFQQGNVKKTRALAYFVPQDIAPHITMIAPLIRFGSIRTMKSHILHDPVPAKSYLNLATAPAAALVPSGKLDVAACNTSITPECLRALYRLGSTKAEEVPGARFGIGGFLEEYARFGMLQRFTEMYAPYAENSNFTVVEVNGGKNNQSDMTDDSSEANLDIQYAVSLSFDTPVVYYSTGGRGPLVTDLDQPSVSKNSNEPYLDFLEYMLNLDDSELPQTLSISYGENEQSVPVAYNKKVCQMFGQLGARGVSVLFSSGDSGPGTSCMLNDGTNRARFMPTFPGACPYVTSVGATQYVNPEHAAAFSSGGFSEIYTRPAYQDKDVAIYLQGLGDRWKGLFNPEGRGFPDVAAQGYAFHILDAGMDQLVDGTSASSPAFAAIVSRLNTARLKSGLPPLGFLNPWLYSAAKGGLTDVVHGGSTGCRGQLSHGVPTVKATVPYASWNATEGWDPATGLGTPLFDKLLQLSVPGFKPTHIEESE